MGGSINLCHSVFKTFGLGDVQPTTVTLQLGDRSYTRLEGKIEDGSIDHIPNKEATRLRRELAKLTRNLDGLRHMTRLPDLLYVIDPDIEVNAVREANILKIPVIAIVDTNCDPDLIDFLIPGNDDAIKATKLITSRIADAVLEGREGRQDVEEPSADLTADAVEAEEDGGEEEETAEASEAIEEPEESEESPTEEEPAPEARLAEEEGSEDVEVEEAASDEEEVEDGDEEETDDDD